MRAIAMYFFHAFQLDIRFCQFIASNIMLPRICPKRADVRDTVSN